MLTIASKSALKVPDIKDKVERGSHFMEVALLDELDELSPEQVFNEAKHDGIFDMIDIVSVHAPAGGIDCLVEIPQCRDRISNTCELASMIANYIGHEIIAMFHTSTNPYTMQSYGTYEDIHSFIDMLACKYSNISLGIESHSEVEYDTKNSQFLYPLSTYGINNGKPFLGATEFARMLDIDKLHPVTDICHVMMISQYLKQIGSFLSNDKVMNVADNFVSLIIESSSSKAQHIHLANTVEHGYGKGHHAMPYNKAEELLPIMEMIISSGFSGNIVLEVSESIHTKSEGYSTTLATVIEVLDSMHVEYRY